MSMLNWLTILALQLNTTPDSLGLNPGFALWLFCLV